jgi:hypothetical protein
MAPFINISMYNLRKRKTASSKSEIKQPEPSVEKPTKRTSTGKRLR